MREVLTEGAPVLEEFPFSQAIEHENTVYLSGNVPLNPETGEFVEGGITVETEQTMENIGQILEEAGCSFADVVKATVFLENPSDFEHFNEVYQQYFEEPYPARSAVVAELLVDASVEIEVVAVTS